MAYFKIFDAQIIEHKDDKILELVGIEFKIWAHLDRDDAFSFFLELAPYIKTNIEVALAQKRYVNVLSELKGLNLIRVFELQHFGEHFKNLLVHIFCCLIDHFDPPELEFLLQSLDNFRSLEV